MAGKPSPGKAFRTAWQDAVRSCPVPESGVTDYRLSSHERLVAFVMSTYGDFDGCNVFPSLDAIARGAAIHRSTVVRIRERLCSAGWIELEHQGGAHPGAPRDTSRYRLTIPDGGRGRTGRPVAQDDRSPSAHRGVALSENRGRTGRPNKENQYKETDKGASADCLDCMGHGWYLGLKDDTAVPCACTRPALKAVR